MDRLFCIHSSNRLELLFSQFKKSFLSGSGPFTERLVVVASPVMRSWLLREMAKDPDLSIAMGIEVIYLNQALGRLGKLFDSDDRERRVVPSRMEMAFAIESEVKIILAEEKSELWSPLALYLKGGAGQKESKRLAALSEELAKYFLQYGIYASQMLDDWSRGPVSNWQQALYQRIMKRYSSWTQPYLELSTIAGLPSQKRDLQVHIFGLNFLSKLHHEFLKKVSKTHPVSYYLLSPCEMFWGDIASDTELAAIRKQWRRQGVTQKNQEELDYYLMDRNVLLANLSRLGRKMLLQIEDDMAFEESHYEEPQGKTLLSSVQRDMLQLTNRTGKISMQDVSIQVHRAPSFFRETEVVYQTILNLIDTKGLSPSEIIVMAPDIRLYAPYIKTVFAGPGNPLETVIFDLRLSSESSPAAAFTTLLSLADSRFEVSKLLQFFEAEEVMRRSGISEENICLLKGWILDAGIRWGKNAEHRSELIERDCGIAEGLSQGTWETGIRRILLGMIMSLGDGEEPALDFLPASNASLTDMDFLEKILRLIRSLREDLRPMTNNQELTLPEWSSYLRCLYDEYFAVDRSDDRALEEEEGLFVIFDRFCKAGSHFSGKKFSWQSIRHHLNKIFQQPAMTASERSLSAVKFCSMLPMRAIPAKAIFLIGMDEDSFPKNDRLSPLDMSRAHPHADYCPTSIDFDRTLFLEALLSARKNLIITYTDEKGEKGPSLLVGELMDYLDDNYEINEKKPSEACLRVHPFDSFDPRYFQGDASPFISYSLRDFNTCLSLQRGRETASPFAADFFTENEFVFDENFKEETVIRLKDLFAFGKNPMKSYFHNLGIYLKDEDNLSDEDHFELSHLQKYQIKMDSLGKPFEKAFSQAAKQGTLPAGLLQESLQSELGQDIGALKDFLGSYGIGEESLLSVELSTENGINCSHAVLTGKMEHLCTEGLLINADKRRDELIASWPKILLLNCLSELFKEKITIKKQIFLLKAKKCLSAHIEDPFLWLDRYVDYYLLCQNNLSPMLPELFEAKDIDKQIDALTNGYNKTYNKELLFSMRDRQKMHPPFVEKWRKKKEESIDLNHEIFGKK